MADTPHDGKWQVWSPYAGPCQCEACLATPNATVTLSSDTLSSPPMPNAPMADTPREAVQLVLREFVHGTTPVVMDTREERMAAEIARLRTELAEARQSHADAERWRAVRENSGVDFVELSAYGDGWVLKTKPVESAADITTPDEYADALRAHCPEAEGG